MVGIKAVACAIPTLSLPQQHFTLLSLLVIPNAHQLTLLPHQRRTRPSTHGYIMSIVVHIGVNTYANLRECGIIQSVVPFQCLYLIDKGS